MDTQLPQIVPHSERVRYLGLDGLRGIAVLLVVGYHLLPVGLLPGGFIGVDMFFVLSGFLITSLLLREKATTGRVRLGTFWLRRARRLLPALALTVVVSGAAAWALGGDILVGIPVQMIGAATFTYNWIAVTAGGDYFANTAPELLRNLWSLAVEEQFYLLWPILFILVTLARSRVARVALVSAAGLISIVIAVIVLNATGDVSRVYYGTDTHAFGLLFGAALAFATFGILDKPQLPATPVIILANGWRAISDPRLPVPRVFDRSIRNVVTSAGVISLVALVTLSAVQPPPDSAYPFYLLTGSLMSVLAILACVWPGSRIGAATDNPLLRWVGERSYGIYLWHWPFLLLATEATRSAETGNVLAPVLAGVLTIVASTASYRWVEVPIRRLGFRGAIAAFRAHGHDSVRRRIVPVIAAVTSGALLAACTAGVVTAPTETEAARQIAAGEAAIAEADQPPVPAPSKAQPPHSDSLPTPRSSPTNSPLPSAGPPPTIPLATPSAAPTPPRPTRSEPPRDDNEEVSGNEVTALGDSVMLASSRSLIASLPGISIDAEVSRSMWAAPRILSSMARRGELRRYVVVGLGTNGAVSRSLLERVLDAVGSERTLVLVTPRAPRQWIDGVNRNIGAFASGHSNVVVADWNAAVSDVPGALASDGIHPTRKGAAIMTETLVAALNEHDAT